MSPVMHNFWCPKCKAWRGEAALTPPIGQFDIQRRRCIPCGTLCQWRQYKPDETAWIHRLIELLEQCVEEQNGGYDALASASWDLVREHWRSKPAHLLPPPMPEQRG